MAERPSTAGTRVTETSGAAANDLSAVLDAIESGAGLPSAVRAVAAALASSVALIDRSGTVLAVAASSPAEERRLLSIGAGVTVTELRVADAVVGEMRLRSARDEAGAPGAARLVGALLALELQRSQSSTWASDEAGSDLVDAVLGRTVTDRGDIVARAAEAGADLGGGAGVLVVRIAPRVPQAEQWRARALSLVLRGLRAVSRGTVATQRETEGERVEIAAIVPGDSDDVLARAAAALERELEASVPGSAVAIGVGRRASDPADVHRSGGEALLAVNVGEAAGERVLAFEDSGSYRLLLPAMSEDPGELERFYEETIAPLAAYDEQYATELVATVEAYLESDGVVSVAAERLFTHRHTIRYRLDRVRELSGHDLGLTDGRERLGLGLKAMRVLGIASPRLPTQEPGAEAGQVRRPTD